MIWYAKERMGGFWNMISNIKRLSETLRIKKAMAG